MRNYWAKKSCFTLLCFLAKLLDVVFPCICFWATQEHCGIYEMWTISAQTNGYNFPLDKIEVKNILVQNSGKSSCVDLPSGEHSQLGRYWPANLNNPSCFNCKYCSAVLYSKKLSFHHKEDMQSQSSSQGPLPKALGSCEWDMLQHGGLRGGEREQ